MTSPQLRDRYLQDSVNTASPGKLLIMLYDRLVLDLMQAEEALRQAVPGKAPAAGDPAAETFRSDDLARRSGEQQRAHEHLTHAQEIVVELLASLDIEAWSGAPGLADFYTWLHSELMGANIARDPGRVAACRVMVEPLRDAWREAAVAAVAG
jgi:flagellar protein FliS